MMLSKSVKLVGGLVALVVSTSCFAQGGDNGVGNGGGGHYCPEAGTIEMYDLWEGRFVHELEIPKWDGKETKLEIIERVLQKAEITQSDTVRDIRKVIEKLQEPGYVTDSTKFDVPLVSLPFSPIAERGCQYVPVVNWFDPNQYGAGIGNRVLRDKKLYDSGPVHFDPLSQAAIDIHEAMYKVVRTYNDAYLRPENAASIRFAVATLFSGQVPKRVLNFKSISWEDFKSPKRAGSSEGRFVLPYGTINGDPCHDVEIRYDNFSKGTFWGWVNGRRSVVGSNGHEVVQLFVDYYATGGSRFTVSLEMGSTSPSVASVEVSFCGLTSEVRDFKVSDVEHAAVFEVVVESKSMDLEK